MDGGIKFKFEAIGTYWEIDIYQDKLSNLEELKEKIDSQISRFVKVFSRFDEESFVYKASNSVLETKLPKDYLVLLDIYQKLYQLTDGLFTPLIGNTLAEAGYDDNYSLVPGNVHPVPAWEEVINFDSPVLGVKRPWILDFGAGGKGFLVDLVGRILDDSGIKSYCVDASGDILYKTAGDNFLRVGMEHPENTDQVIGVVGIKNQSLCASAGNRRKWDKYHHIFNPKTLSSVDEVKAVWVIAETGLIADCLATCLFLVEPEKLIKGFQFEYLVVYKDFSFRKSLNFKGEIYYN